MTPRKLAEYRTHQTVSVAGRLPGDAEEFYEIDSVEGDVVYARRWQPWPGCFGEFVYPIPANDIDRVVVHDRLPVLPSTPKEPAHACPLDPGSPV